MDKPNYFGIIPASVRYADIAMGAKLIYSELTALCQKEGYCWASNKYFSQLYGTSSKTISNWINDLKNHDFISVEIYQDKGNMRKIWLNVGLGVRKKTSKGMEENFQRGMEENFIYNNTRNNNKNNNKYVEKESLRPEQKETEKNEVIEKDQVFIQQIHKVLGGKGKLRAVEKPISMLKKRRKRFSDDEIATAVLHLSKSPFHMGKNERGWHADVQFILRSDDQVEKWLNDESWKINEERNYDGII